MHLLLVGDILRLVTKKYPDIDAIDPRKPTARILSEMIEDLYLKNGKEQLL